MLICNANNPDQWTLQGECCSSLTITKGKPSHHVALSTTRFVPAFTNGSLISAGLLSALRDRDLGTQLWGPPPPGTDGCVSHDVDLEALNSQFWQSTALEFTTPLSRRKVRRKGINQRKMKVEKKGMQPVT